MTDDKKSVSHFVVAESTTVSEIIFGSVGPMCHDQGWCVIPQQRSGRRLPSIYQREAIKWGLYHDERPDRALVLKWAEPCFNENVAVILGPPSGYVWSLDIDIKDWRLADEVEALAMDILGHTPYKRIGNRPKRALFWRAETPADLPKNMSKMFVCENGDAASEHGIEILAHKKMQTIYGRHHQTYDHFTWGSRKAPALSSPQDVPATTLDQIDRFIIDLEKIRPFHRNRSASSGTIGEFVDDGKVRRPRLAGSGDWVVENGIVVDGREKFLWALASQSARANAGLCSEDRRGELKALVLDEFRTQALVDGSWTGKLEREVNDKVDRASTSILDGTTRPISPTVRTISRKRHEVSESGSSMTSGRKDGLAWIPASISRSEIKDVIFSDKKLEGTALEEIQIPETATESSRRISNETQRGIHGFFVDLAVQDPAVHARTHVAAGPTGAGKTHMTLQEIADFHESHGDPENPYPFLYIVPTYKNIAEAAEKAHRMGLSGDEVVEFIGKARCATLTTEDRCIRGEDIARLQESGRSTHGLCQWTDPDDPEKEIFCIAFDTCRYQKQLKQVPNAKIVFAVHAYISCSIPAVLNDISSVIIDESFHKQLLSSERFPDSVLDLPRSGVAFLTKKEKEAGVSPESFTDDREFIATAIRAWIRKGKDPAEWFLRESDGQSIETKKSMLERTISLLSRVIDDGTVKPTTTSARIEKMCAAPERRFVHQEEKFWRIVRERVELSGAGNTPSIAPGKRDCRILWQRGPEADAPGTIRISWTKQHNFEDKHILALDASADKSLVARVLDRKESEIVFNTIDNLLRVRTCHIAGRSFSKTSLLPHATDDEPMAAYRSRLRVFIRNLISHIAAMHPVGGIVVCMPKSLREFIQHGWAGPDRCLWMHYGATKGLNFAERCDAAIAIGCISPSIQQLDDIVAALAYGDDDPESPIDPIGEHRLHGEKDVPTVLRDETIQLRNGHTMTVSQRSADGRYARLALDQIRREEHLQFLGRLRPIHRDRVTSFFNLGSYIPPSIIVDEVIDWTDLKTHIGNAVETAREVRGHIGARDDDGDLMETKRFMPIATSDPVRKKMFQLSSGGEVLYVPAHTPSFVDRYVDDGYEVISAPTLEPMPDIDDDRCSFDEEVRIRDAALAAAIADGWKFTPGSRTWTRTIKTETVIEGKSRLKVEHLEEDVAVVADIYAVRAAMAPLAEVVAEPDAAAQMPGAIDEYAEG